MPVTVQPVPLRPIPGWRDDPIFPQQNLKTSIELAKEYWIILRVAADVYAAGKTLFTRHGRSGDLKRPWTVFRSSIHQAANSGLAAASSTPEAEGLLYDSPYMS